MRTTASLSTSPFSNIACPEQWTVGAFLWIISDTASNILLHDFLLRASTINISSCKTAVLCKITPKISTTLNFSGTWAMLFSIIFTRLMVHLYARFHNQLCSFSYFLMPSPCPRKYLQVHTFVIEGILLKYENTISEMWEQNLGSTLTFFSTYVHSDKWPWHSSKIIFNRVKIWKQSSKIVNYSKTSILQNTVYYIMELWF